MEYGIRQLDRGIEVKPTSCHYGIREDQVDVTTCNSYSLILSYEICRFTLNQLAAQVFPLPGVEQRQISAGLPDIQESWTSVHNVHVHTTDRYDSRKARSKQEMEMPS